MQKWIDYEVMLPDGRIIKNETLQSLEDLQKEHKKIGYTLVSYNGIKTTK